MSWSVACAHPETMHCHSEPFDRLRTGSAKNLRRQASYEILRRYTPQNDTLGGGFRMDTS